MPIGVRIYGHSFSRLEVLERHVGAANSVLGFVRHHATHRLGGGGLLLRGKTRSVEQPGNGKHAAQDANAPTNASASRSGSTELATTGGQESKGSECSNYQASSSSSSLGDQFQLHGICVHDLQFNSALGAVHRLPFFDIIFEVNCGPAFGTKGHASPPGNVSFTSKRKV